MNRYPPGGRSKATATTLCQKCLKTDNYECKKPAQERPYMARPSRTQQLFNPKLVPKLTSDVPNDLLRKKGVADDILAKKSDDRGRSRSKGSLPQRKHSRSPSSASSSSVSTISTNMSRSPSPKIKKRHRPRKHSGSPGSFRPVSRDRKRRRRSVSSSSYSSRSHGTQPENQSQWRDSNTRRRLSSFSPQERGRRRSRSSSSRMERSRSRSMGRRRSGLGTSVRSSSQVSWTRQYSRSRSPDQYIRGKDRRSKEARVGGSAATGSRPSPNGYTSNKATAPPPAAARERSLSPYSKRLALTQAMNMGRGGA